MAALPLELWTEICWHLDKTSLRALRCVNKTFAEVGARFLFEGIVITFLPEYFHKLTEIAFSPSLRYHVKTIYLDASLLSSEYLKFQDWSNAVDIRVPKDRWHESRQERTNQGDSEEENEEYDNLERLPGNVADCDYHWSQYLRLHEGQKHIIDNNLDGPMLTAALTLLPNLARILPVEDLFTDRGSSVHDAIKDHEVDWLPALTSIQKATLLERPFADPEDSTSPDAARPLTSILIALAMSRSHIDAFKYLAVPWVFWNSEGAMSYWPGVRSQIDQAFRNLRSLELNLVDGSDAVVASHGSPIWLQQITSFVQSAPQLRILNIQFNCNRSNEGIYEGNHTRIYSHWCSSRLRSISAMFSCLVLPQIEELDLRFFSVHRKDFVTWLERHNRTLKILRLHNVYMTDPFDGMKESNTWERAAKSVAPSLSSLELVDLRLIQDQEIDARLREDLDIAARDYLHHAFTKRVSDYLLHKGQMAYPRWHQPLVTILPSVISVQPLDEITNT